MLLTLCSEATNDAICQRKHAFVKCSVISVVTFYLSLPCDISGVKTLHNFLNRSLFLNSPHLPVPIRGLFLHPGWVEVGHGRAAVINLTFSGAALEADSSPHPCLASVLIYSEMNLDRLTPHWPPMTGPGEVTSNLKEIISLLAPLYYCHREALHRVLMKNNKCKDG